MAEAEFQPRFVSPKPKVGEEGGIPRRVQDPRSQGERREREGREKGAASNTSFWKERNRGRTEESGRVLEEGRQDRQTERFRGRGWGLKSDVSGLKNRREF